MNDLTIIIMSAYEMLAQPLNIFGFNISILNVIIWSTVATLVIWFVREIKK
jgi:hypothetical protein